MSIPKGCIEAAAIHRELTKNGWAEDSAEACARRVLLALKKEMPEDAVKSAADRVFELLTSFTKNDSAALDQEMVQSFTALADDVTRATIAAFLTHVAGDTP